jgi:hypothetical protein
VYGAVKVSCNQMRGEVLEMIISPPKGWSESFQAQNLNFQKCPQKYVTCDILNFQKYWLICYIIKEITRNKSDLDLSETSIEVFPQAHHAIHRTQAYSFAKVNGTPAFTLCNFLPYNSINPNMPYDDGWLSLQKFILKYEKNVLCIFWAKPM